MRSPRSTPYASAARSHQGRMTGYSTARGCSIVTAAVLLAAALAARAQTQAGVGPASAGGAVVATSTTTTTTLIVPSAGAADVNCPATVPTQNNQTTIASTISTAITCPTPARTTTVASISFWAGTGAVGAHQKCSVYTFPPGYVS